MQVAEHPFFEHVEADHVQEILAITQVRKLAAEDVIFDEGDNADGLFLVLDGRIAFRKRLREDDWLNINHAAAGDYFGEIGVLTEEPRSLRAVAEKPSVVAKIPGAALVEFIRNISGPMERLLQSIIRHLHQTTRHYVDDRLHQEKMAVVGGMVNTIIHDFKNPFCLISLSAQMLRQKHDDIETRRLCLNIEHQIDRMVAMAAELAEYSRGEHKLRVNDLELSELFAEFRGLYWTFFDHPKVSVTIDVPEIHLRGEKAKLFRVFQNLIGNAIEAFGDNQGSIVIQAVEKPRKRLVMIRISDNAGGIPKQIQAHMFEPFVTYGKREGTGLGAAIAKSIIEAHGGSISFKTEAGKGTDFLITLPTLPVRQKAPVRQ